MIREYASFFFGTVFILIGCLACFFAGMTFSVPEKTIIFFLFGNVFLTLWSKGNK